VAHSRRPPSLTGNSSSASPVKAARAAPLQPTVTFSQQSAAVAHMAGESRMVVEDSADMLDMLMSAVPEIGSGK
jgi:hypothetical protein